MLVSRSIVTCQPVLLRWTRLPKMENLFNVMITIISLIDKHTTDITTNYDRVQMNTSRIVELYVDATQLQSC